MLDKEDTTSEVGVVAHGEVVGHLRWCAGCRRKHGIYYRCEHYDAAINAQIDKGEHRFNALLDDPDSGLPEEARAIYRALRGDKL